jgi:alcohol dehydrogenase class IV
VEGILADGLHPFSDTLALHALRVLPETLPRTKALPADLTMRTESQLAAWQSFTLPAASANGLSHVMGKQIGARHGIPHGVTSCLLMPHVMRYLADNVEGKGDLLAGMEFGSSKSGGDAYSAVDAAAALIAELGLPQHIADYGIGEPELRRAAEELAGRYPAEDLLGIYLAAL